MLPNNGARQHTTIRRGAHPFDFQAGPAQGCNHEADRILCFLAAVVLVGTQFIASTVVNKGLWRRLVPRASGGDADGNKIVSQKPVNGLNTLDGLI
jgi:hypothetical protein